VPARRRLLPGVVNVITNAPEDAPALIETLIAHPAVRGSTFTGSTRVGRIIAQVGRQISQAGAAELGGKAPMIVLDDADIRRRVAAAGVRRLHEPGPDLHVDERIVVDRQVGRRLRNQTRAESGIVVAGDPRKGNARGSLIGHRRRGPSQALINGRVSKGAQGW
jgi:acyl-CoA reductase-like NAD-dependent aldehyde dehydrogenase